MVLNSWVNLCGICGGENGTTSGRLWILGFNHHSSFNQCPILVCDYPAECSAPILCSAGLVFKSPSADLLFEIYG
jgi:hypothetical protein